MQSVKVFFCWLNASIQSLVQLFYCMRDTESTNMEAFMCDSCRESVFLHVEDFIKFKLDAQVSGSSLGVHAKNAAVFLNVTNFSVIKGLALHLK